jgi:type IV pilus assembly protein PilF
MCGAGSLKRGRPIERIVALLAAAALAAALSACHSSPPPYQNPDRHRKPEPEQAAIANMKMALEYMRINNLAQARDRIERALGEAPDNPNVQETAGLVYERLNDLPKAKHAFSAAARLGKNDPDILNSYAGFLCRTGKAAEGEKLFIQVAQNPVYRTPEVALLNAGVCLGSSGDVVDAERYFNRALTIKPNMPEALLQLGNLAYSRGDYKQALDDVQRYLAVNAPSAEILWLGFRTQRKLGDTPGAIVFGRRIQTEFPDSEQAQQLRAGVDR